MSAIGDDASKTSPLFDYLNTALVTGSWKPSQSHPSITAIRTVVAPLSGGGTLKFKTATRWETPPPGSVQGSDGWQTRAFAAGQKVEDVQIVEIAGADNGSSAGIWEIFV